MFTLFILFVVVYALIRGKKMLLTESELGEEMSEEDYVEKKVEDVLKNKDVEILEYEYGEWYKVRSGSVVVEVYMDEEYEDTVKHIIYGSNVIYSKTKEEPKTTKGRLMAV